MIKYEIRRQQVKRRRRLVATFAGAVVLIAAIALMVPALSMTLDKATQEAGFFPQANQLQATSVGLKAAAVGATSESPVINDDGTVQTIANPAGTTIDLFDYWIDDDLKDTQGRAAWPGGWNGNGWSQKTTDTAGQGKSLTGTGNNEGINKDHAFKFSPAWGGTVQNGTTGMPTSDGEMVNGNYSLNGWTGSGSTRNGTPSQGIVQDTLDNGYPKLGIDAARGTNGESLAYLFDPNIAHSGKASYKNANHLFYVDSEGYYTFQSSDYNAVFDKASDGGLFTLTEQSSPARPQRGFWPFGQENFWVGMHMHTQFSMPANGSVLNPAGQNRPMTFEFAGDDDAWVYLDGILVGDGGGIHNITRIKIDFSNGDVFVFDDDNGGREVTKTTLKALYEKNGIADKYEWKGNTYADFSYHTFDFFYLERGGGESNLYIRYNLVSTYDFTGHKAYEGNPSGVLSRDQFQFELIGLDGQYGTDGQLKDPGKHAIMPTPNVSDSTAPAGTVAHPTLIRDEVAKRSIYTVGVSEDGNINFGSANIDSQEMNAADNGNPSVYRYIIREVVPDNAVNDEGIAYGDATEEQRAAGGFVLNEARYDNKVYYMTAQVTSWTDNNGIIQHGLSKAYYTDSDYSQPASDSFISFTNTYSPGSGSVDFDKVDASGNAVSGAQFTLYTDRKCTVVAKNLDGNNAIATSGANGIVSFDNMSPDLYYMKETAAPSGYAANSAIYKVQIVDSRGQGAVSSISVFGDSANKPVAKIVNTKEGEISVSKEWLDQSGKTISGGERQARVKIQRKRYVGGSDAVPHTVTFTVKIDTRPDLEYTFTDEGVLGDSVTVDWWDTNQLIQSLSVADRSGNQLSYAKSDYWDETHHKNRKVVVNNIANDANIVVTYPSDKDWLFTSEHTPWMKDVSVVGSGGSYTAPTLEEDAEFNSSQDATRFAMLTSPNWCKTWTIGDGKDFPASNEKGQYKYYVVEVDGSGNPVPIGQETELGYVLQGYSPNNADGVEGSGTISVYNRINETPIGITIKKVDKQSLNDSNPAVLTGAAFRLEKYSSSFYQGKDDSWHELIEQDVDGTGVFRFEGLSSGYYKIVETKTPDGYLKLDADPKFEVCTNDQTGDLEVVFHDSSDYIRYDAGSNCIFFGNEAGGALPNTGGIGTTIFTVVGVLLIVGGALLLWRRRK